MEILIKKAFLIVFKYIVNIIILLLVVSLNWFWNRIIAGNPKVLRTILGIKILEQRILHQVIEITEN